jgi:subtilisin family serine protease
MQTKAKLPRLLSALIFCGAIGSAASLESNPANAFGGGFGRMGGFRGAPAYGGMRGQPGFGAVRGPVYGGVRGPMRPYPGGVVVIGRPIGGRGVYPRDPRHPIVGTGGPPALGPPLAAQLPPGGGRASGSGVPPTGERRFVADEIVTEVSANVPPQAIEAMARRYNLTRLDSVTLPLIGSTVYRWRVGGRRSVADIVGAIEDQHAVIASAQPNYVFSLQEDVAKDPPRTGDDAAQYVRGKLQIDQAHHLATGKNVPIAVIDSEIDANHPDLAGTAMKSFDALGGEQKPHQHGTAMAGAIAAHGKLVGVALGPQLLAARAFDDTPGEAKGTSFAIYKSLQWAADNSARVVNMSFAGPPDPLLHRMLAAAYDKGMVLIAAAGNAGPNSAPLYPAADADVIAVTATDMSDGLYKMANRGQFIAVAAPGVDVLALAPGESYQVTTGTSVAAAEVSGIAALLLELKPSLTPADIRAILLKTAKPMGASGQQADFGAGVANAYRAVTTLNGKPEASGSDEKPGQ